MAVRTAHGQIGRCFFLVVGASDEEIDGHQGCVYVKWSLCVGRGGLLTLQEDMSSTEPEPCSDHRHCLQPVKLVS